VFQSRPLLLGESFEGILGDDEIRRSAVSFISVPTPTAKRTTRAYRAAKNQFTQRRPPSALHLGCLRVGAHTFENYQLAYTPRIASDILVPAITNGSQITELAEMKEDSHTVKNSISKADDTAWWPAASGSTSHELGVGNASGVPNRCLFSAVVVLDPFGSRQS